MSAGLVMAKLPEIDHEATKNILKLKLETFAGLEEKELEEVSNFVSEDLKGFIEIGKMNTDPLVYVQNKLDAIVLQEGLDPEKADSIAEANLIRIRNKDQEFYKERFAFAIKKKPEHEQQSFVEKLAKAARTLLIRAGGIYSLDLQREEIRMLANNKPKEEDELSFSGCMLRH